MSRTIVIQYVTLDGVIQDPDGSDGTPFGGWAMRYGPEGTAGDKFRLGDIMSTGILLFGRRTWDHFSDLWPPRSSDFAILMNEANKAVVTGRAVDLTRWSNTSAVTVDLTDWLRATLADRDVVVIGSTSLVRTLMDADLVDEYRLITFPIAVGAGRRLFPAPISLELVSAEQSGPGTLSTYRKDAR